MKLRLKIALVTETYLPEVNGVAMTLGRLADGLKSRGHYLGIVRPRQKHERVGKQLDGQLLTPGMPLPGYAELRFGLPAKRMILRRWIEDTPNIVHVATEGPLGLSALAAAHTLRIPVVSTFHTNFHSYSRHYGIGWMKGSIEGYLRWFHNRTATTLAPTHELAKSLIRRGFHNVGVLARGVDTRLFNPARRSAALRASWGAHDHTPVIMVVGRVAAEKNLELALQAFSAIRAQLPEAAMVIVGDGPLRQSLARKHPECRFVGARHGEELARHYASADLFLFPSLTETYGNVVSEALASGLPVIAYDYAAAAGLIDDNRNGLLITPGDEGSFIAAARDLATSPERLEAMRVNCSSGNRQPDWEHIHEHYEKVLRQVMMRHEREIAEEAWIRFLPD